ncbi:MAG: site-2 protease family protein [Sphingopyxis sp.]
MSDISSWVYSIATWLAPLVIAIVFHEVAHGRVAKHFGDMTASNAGRLSFNPIRHIDPVGTVALPMILALSGAPVFGWAKPVPVNFMRLRKPRLHMMLVALAGPMMNMLLAMVALLAMAGMIMAFRGTAHQGAIGFILSNLGNFLTLNVMLAVFNMLPLPPFDGGHVMEGLLPRSLARHYGRLRQYGMLIPILLIIVVPMATGTNPLASIIIPPVQAILGLFNQLLTQFI